MDTDHRLKVDEVQEWERKTSKKDKIKFKNKSLQFKEVYWNKKFN